MTTLVVSDLHLGSLSGADVLRHAEPRAQLVAALRDADRLVLLGDALELRERPLAQALAIAAPVLEALGEAMSGGQVVIVPGNHDHHLAGAWLEHLRLDGAERALGLEQRIRADAGGLLGWVADRLAPAEASLAYPGVFLRDDVYALHGHYLDVHLTMPRPESLLARVLARSVRGPNAPYSTPAHYEHALAPMYAFFYRVAQGDARTRSLAQGRGLSRWVFGAARGGGGLRGRALTQVAVPAAVRALNAAGLGPFGADLTAVELRRSALRAMAECVRRLGVTADHVVFGHTHRLGPLPADERSEWELPGGPRLWNCGSWFHEPVLLSRPGAEDSPYWPGGCIAVDADGDPRPRALLREVELPPPRVSGS